jgi:hypothetical protein
MNHTEVTAIMNAKSECGDLTKRASNAVGRRMFASYFEYSNHDAASQLVGDWISRNTGPLWWFRNMLVEVGTEDLSIAHRILVFLCKPFGLIPVREPSGGADPKREIIAAMQGILKAVALVIKESTDARATPRKIEAACDESIAQILSLKQYVQKAK